MLKACNFANIVFKHNAICHLLYYVPLFYFITYKISIIAYA